jgi:hypothetical protein
MRGSNVEKLNLRGGLRISKQFVMFPLLLSQLNLGLQP